jgi:hypothetical protein
MPNNRERSNQVVAIPYQAPMPIPEPAVALASRSTGMSRSKGKAPRAERTPHSRLRSPTECEMAAEQPVGDLFRGSCGDR